MPNSISRTKVAAVCAVALWPGWALADFGEAVDALLRLLAVAAVVIFLITWAIAHRFGVRSFPVKALTGLALLVAWLVSLYFAQHEYKFFKATARRDLHAAYSVRGDAIMDCAVLPGCKDWFTAVANEEGCIGAFKGAEIKTVDGAIQIKDRRNGNWSPAPVDPFPKFRLVGRHQQGLCYDVWMDPGLFTILDEHFQRPLELAAPPRWVWVYVWLAALVALGVATWAWLWFIVGLRRAES
jgi:hypothetical protein